MGRAGEVVAQNPRPGTVLAPGARVSVTWAFELLASAGKDLCQAGMESPLRCLQRVGSRGA